MNYWLFQTHPNDYLLSASLAFLDKEPWPVTAFRDEIAPGDLVFFGMYGGNEGVYALGRITSKPADFEYPSAEVQSFWLNSDVVLDNETWVWVEYLTKIHDEPLMRSHLFHIPELKDLATFTTEVGDPDFNFKVSEEQAKIIFKLFPNQMGGDNLPEDAKALAGI